MKTHRILIVDDQHEVRRVLRSGLETLGSNFQVLDTPSAEEAMLVLFRHTVDLLVVDFRLPGISGLELMEKVRRRSPDVKVILITGVQDQRIKRQIVAANPFAFFIKPVDMVDFLDLVERALGLHSEKTQEHTETPVQKAAGDPAQESAGRKFNHISRLESLLEETKASAVVLIDKTGKLLAQSGKLPPEAEQKALFEHLVNVIRSGVILSASLGPKKVDSYLSFQGASFSLLLSLIDEEFALVVFGEKGKLSPRALSVQIAVDDLRQGFTEQSSLGTNPGPELIEASGLQAEAPQVEEVEINQEDIRSVEALFQKAPGMLSTKDDLAHFWDNLVEDEMDGNIKENTLSFEEALRLGLTPDED